MAYRIEPPVKKRLDMKASVASSVAVLSARRQTTIAAMKIAVASDSRPRYRTRRTLSRPRPVEAGSVSAGWGAAGLIGTAESKYSKLVGLETDVNKTLRQASKSLPDYYIHYDDYGPGTCCRGGSRPSVYDRGDEQHHRCIGTRRHQWFFCRRRVLTRCRPPQQTR